MRLTVVSGQGLLCEFVMDPIPLDPQPVESPAFCRHIGTKKHEGKWYCPIHFKAVRDELTQEEKDAIGDRTFGLPHQRSLGAVYGGMGRVNPWLTYTAEGEPLDCEVDLFRMDGLEFMERTYTEEEAAAYQAVIDETAKRSLLYLRGHIS